MHWSYVFLTLTHWSDEENHYNKDGGIQWLQKLELMFSESCRVKWMAMQVLDHDKNDVYYDKSYTCLVIVCYWNRNPMMKFRRERVFNFLWVYMLDGLMSLDYLSNRKLFPHSRQIS